MSNLVYAPATTAQRGKVKGQQIIDAWDHYDADPNSPVARHGLLSTVQAYARDRFQFTVERDQGWVKKRDTWQDDEDLAADLAVEVWTNITGADGKKKFEGNGVQFYSWLRKAIFNDSIDEGESKGNYIAKHEPLFITGRDEDGDEVMIENPALYDESAETHSIGHASDTDGDGGKDGKPKDVAVEVEYDPAKPEDHFMALLHGSEISGIDRTICLLGAAGKPYSAIAEIVHISENAVKSRVKRLNKRYRYTSNGRLLRVEEWHDLHAVHEAGKKPASGAVTG